MKKTGKERAIGEFSRRLNEFIEKRYHGAMLRSRYQCRVYRDDAGNWRLESFDLME